MLCGNKKFYVIGVYGDPWVLDSFNTKERATRAINWQGGQSTDWAIVKRTGETEFVEISPGNRKWNVERGPYTAEAFNSFKAEWTQ